MSTTYPTSKQSFTNPTAADKTNAVTVPHATQHANINDTVEAIQDALGYGTATNAVMRKIATVQGNGSSAVLEFSSITASYRSLMVVLVGRSTAAVTNVVTQLTFETTPTAGAYDHQLAYAANTTFTAAENIGANDYIHCLTMPGNSSTANLHGAAVIEIPEYTNGSVWKTVLARVAALQTLSSGNLLVGQSVGVWESTAAISRIRLTASSGNWSNTSIAHLYGIPS